MTEDAFLFTEWFFSYIWAFFVTWKIPGTGMTPAQWLFFLLLVPVFVRFVSWFFKATLNK